MTDLTTVRLALSQTIRDFFPSLEAADYCNNTKSQKGDTVFKAFTSVQVPIAKIKQLKCTV
jgi:hypothetical protein